MKVEAQLVDTTPKVTYKTSSNNPWQKEASNPWQKEDEKHNHPAYGKDEKNP